MARNLPERITAQIPRGTCKLFGAIKALSTIRNSVILVHGPKGCVYHINYILGMRGDRPSEIYTTGLNEHDVIFGAEQKLTAAIEELDRALHPDFLFVLSCCSSGIIGEDVESAARNSRTGGEVIPISAGGFEGDFHEGYSETLCQLVRQLARGPGGAVPRSVNLVGVLRAGPDLAELRLMLGRIGVTVNAVLTADATREELSRLGRAALNIVLCEPSGKEAAGLLEALYGTPYIIEELPIGRNATARFLGRIAGALGLPEPIPPPADTALSVDAGFLRNRRIAIISGPTRAVSVTRFLGEYGIIPQLVVVDFDSSVQEKLESLIGSEGMILVEPGHGRIVGQLKEQKIDLILGGMLELPFAKSLGIGHIDIMHGSEKTVGFVGAMNLERLLSDKYTPDR